MKPKLLLTSLIALLLIPVAFSLFPREITEVFKLTDENGTIKTGHHSCNFSIWDNTTSGNIFYSENISFTTTTGIVEVQLSPNIEVNQSLFMEIDCDGDGAMTPRKNITSVFSCYYCELCNQTQCPDNQVLFGNGSCGTPYDGGDGDGITNWDAHLVWHNQSLNSTIALWVDNDTNTNIVDLLPEICWFNETALNATIMLLEVNDTDGVTYWGTDGTNIYNDTAKVGIGTSSPIDTLQVDGNIRMVDGNPDLIFNETDRDTGPWKIILNIDDLGFMENTAAAGDFSTTNNVLWLETGGEIGIGDTTPQEKLDVAGNVRGDAWIEYSEEFEGDALKIISGINAIENAGIGFKKTMHRSLPDYLIRVYEEEGSCEYNNVPEHAECIFDEDTNISTTYGRSLNDMVAVNRQAIKQLLYRIILLEAKIEALEHR